MGWSLLPNELPPFKIYWAPPTIISQLVLFLWQPIKIDPLGHVRVVAALQNFVQKCNPAILSQKLIRLQAQIPFLRRQEFALNSESHTFRKTNFKCNGFALKEGCHNKCNTVSSGKQQVMEKIVGHGYAAGFPDNTGEQLFKSKPQSICSISDFTLLSITGRYVLYSVTSVTRLDGSFLSVSRIQHCYYITTYIIPSQFRID